MLARSVVQIERTPAWEGRGSAAKSQEKRVLPTDRQPFFTFVDHDTKIAAVDCRRQPTGDLLPDVHDLQDSGAKQSRLYFAPDPQ